MTCLWEKDFSNLYPKILGLRKISVLNPMEKGEHLWIYIEKKALTTFEAIEILAEYMGDKRQQINYSGLKDKQAVSRQWLSIHWPVKKDLPVFDELDIRIKVLKIQRHGKKLKTGSHRSNRFVVIIKNFSGDKNDIIDRVKSLQDFGMANYFGEQRFGRSGENVQQALAYLSKSARKRKTTRRKRSMLISSLRSELFNRILSERIKRGFWKKPVNGDLWILNGSQSHFQQEIDNDILSRYQQMDIHSAISLYGSGESKIGF